MYFFWMELTGNYFKTTRRATGIDGLLTKTFYFIIFVKYEGSHFKELSFSEYVGGSIFYISINSVILKF